MKAYSVVENYFDYCDVWSTIESYHFKEESAEKRKKEIQERYKKEKLDLEKNWVEVSPIEISED